MGLSEAAAERDADPAAEPTPGRRAHYRDFYDGFDNPDGLPVLAVVGNCQAESLRLLLDHDDVRTVRMPAVHELGPRELAPLRALLARLDLLVAQPVGDDYRGLPLGTRQLLAVAPAHLRHVLLPSLRYAGRHPHHVIVHPPHLPHPDPPVVPYHDLRTVVRAAGARAGRTAPVAPPLAVAAVRATADDSVAELARREEAGGLLVVSDLLRLEQRPEMRTINHPGNALLTPVAARVRDALGLSAATPRIDRPLLNGIHAPVEPAVAEVFGDAPARATWLVDGREVGLAEVEEAQLRWYAGRPDVVDEVLRRSTRQLTRLGLVAP